MTSITFDEYRDACASGFRHDFCGPLLWPGESAVLKSGDWYLVKGGDPVYGVPSWRASISALDWFIELTKAS